MGNNNPGYTSGNFIYFGIRLYLLGIIGFAIIYHVLRMREIPYVEITPKEQLISIFLIALSFFAIYLLIKNKFILLKKSALEKNAEIVNEKLLDSDFYEGHVIKGYKILSQLSESFKLNKIPKFAIIKTNSYQAFASGSERKSMVSISNGALLKLSDNSIRSIIAHELGHIVNKDTMVIKFIVDMFRPIEKVTNRIKQSIRGCFFWALILFLLPAFLVATNISFLNSYIFSILIGIILTPWIGFILLGYYSRKREFFADAAGANFVGIDSMIKMLEILYKDNISKQIEGNDSRLVEILSYLNPHRKTKSYLYKTLGATHPTLDKRVIALKEKKYFR